MSGVDLTVARLLWRGRPGQAERASWAEAWGPALIAEVERLRCELDRAQRGERYHERDAQLLRDERWQMRREITAALSKSRVRATAGES